MIEKKLPVQMIYFMTERAGQEVLAFRNDFFSVEIDAAQYNSFRAHDFFGESGDTQAAFLFILLPFGGHDFGIYNRKKLILLLAAARVRDHESLGNADLR